MGRSLRLSDGALPFDGRSEVSGPVVHCGSRGRGGGTLCFFSYQSRYRRRAIAEAESSTSRVLQLLPPPLSDRPGTRRRIRWGRSVAPRPLPSRQTNRAFSAACPTPAGSARPRSAIAATNCTFGDTPASVVLLHPCRAQAKVTKPCAQYGRVRDRGCSFPPTVLGNRLTVGAILIGSDHSACLEANQHK